MAAVLPRPTPPAPPDPKVDDDVVVFACRDAADRERRGCQPLPPGLLVVDRDQVRRLGAGAPGLAGGPESELHPATVSAIKSSASLSVIDE